MRGSTQGVRSAALSTCAAAAVLLTAACGTQGPDGAGQSTSTSEAQQTSTHSTTGTSTPTGTATPSPSATGSSDGASSPIPSATAPPKKPGSALRTLTGTLADGVEPNCVVLRTDNGIYVLLGVPAKVRELGPGTTIHARGTVASSAATTCQQGTPFRVDTASPA